MALCMRKSLNLINLLKSKMGLLGTINPSPWASTLSRHHEFPVPAQTAQNLGSSDGDWIVKAIVLSSRRFKWTKAEKQLISRNDVDDNKVLDFPGGKVSFTPEMRFIPESPEERTRCYRVLDGEGQLIIGNNFVQVSKELAVKMYTDMVTLQTMDTIFYEAQRQGRISFYLTTIGEEAINIATAAALSIDDHVFPQYREPGVLLWRGFTLQEFANQCFGNKFDYGKGRQMPIHYGSNKHNYFTVSSTIATQIPHAVGAAYSLKMDRKEACAVTYFGDGGTSEGDFHAALNFAAVMEAPVIFICRNNGWAISTPTSDQFRSDGAVVRGQAYGVRSIRVDGNDALAIYSAVLAAREMAICEHRPILIELLHAIQVAEKLEKPPVADIFTDVYDVPPSNLQEQEKLLKETIKRHPQDYPSDVPS
ncbi:2-oxoisovalerate dehydrogenase subunit alpha 2, mitochondrial-like isoform X4 [Carya illinoinensis]|uniref:Dehydrogenase E1 component domain-containing protein n=1 Tax=Carya illinoinensis TaxID=32201 RepID=A0A8T1R2S0_CARIL|nr:2-oxoisovalerate dehydrogenase subunit alpha 2, mitochondrial-like isoform X4 [Carya illinoinensis]KAG6660663.1 hypothetical protein CIPAW_03G120500 [Carya illinoinensis]